jgi:hypothetical protein
MVDIRDKVGAGLVPALKKGNHKGYPYDGFIKYIHRRITYG